MNLSHHPRHLLVQPTRRSRFQRGYVLVMFALLLVPILLVSGLAVDIGHWYDRAADLRKAADAAALAGVVWLPDEQKAREAALDAAARNGFVPGNGISIEVTPSAAYDKRLKVSITDERVGSFFYGNLGGRDITLKRSSYAEYILPVPLGSPRNYFGTGPLVPAPNTELLFQSVNPFCTSKVQGDRHQSGYFSESPTHCSGESNQGPAGEFLPDGYELFIDAPDGGPGPIEILLYDPRYNAASISPGAIDEPMTWVRGAFGSIGNCPTAATGQGANSYNSQGYCVYNTARRFNGPITYWNGTSWVDQLSGLTESTNYVLRYYQSWSGPDSYLSNSNEENFTFTLYEENSPFTTGDDVQVCQRTFSRNTAFELTYLGSTRWNRLCTVTPSATNKRFILKVRNEGPGGTPSTRGNGSNQWGMVARYTGGWTGNLGNGLCDGRTQVICPRVYGKNAISVYANTTQGVAQFFLAEIDPKHAGKKLYLELWDPGEGGSSLRILQPDGDSWSRKNMTWSSYLNQNTIAERSGSGDTIDVTGDIFNGRKLVIEIDLTGYDPDETNKWWKIEYEFNNPDRPNVTDRTTWTARIEGNPVHLVEEN